MSYLGINTKQYLSKNEKIGELLTFLDGSKWQVNPIDKMKTALWLPSKEIIVSIEGTQYLLTNIKKKETVNAKYLSKKST